MSQDNPAIPTDWLTRVDDAPDEDFYTSARLVAHIDPQTIAALTKFYGTFIPPRTQVLDLMSSWISHLPDALNLDRVVGLGMNAEELQKNPRLTEWCVHNLNADPRLPYAPDTFDCVLIAVSVQYLTQPLPVMASVYDTLKPGGKICIAMSHRLFPTKAIAAFRHLSAQDRVRLVMYYLESAGFTAIEFHDESPADGDPLWLVTGSRL